MNRVFISLTIVVLVVGGYFFFTHNKGGQDSFAPFVLDQEQATAAVENSEIPTQISKPMRAIFETNKGKFEIELFAEATPNTVNNFVKLAESGFYNGTRFHRVIKGFMIQGGDPLSKDLSMQERWGTGGPGYKYADEISNNNQNIAGTISMANAGPDTNGSQFFINTVDNSYLDSKHTVFGKVISGIDVVQKIENVPTAEANRPVDEVVVQKVTIQ